MVSEKDVQAYKRDGVIVVPEGLGADTLAQVRSVIAELVAGSAKTLEHTDVYDLEPGHTAENPRVRRIKTPHKVNALFNDIVRSAPVLDILKKLLGPGRPAAARLQAQHEVGAIRLAGRMASGLGVLSAHQ
jgi:phytanoyl-CoA hydroxylase